MGPASDKKATSRWWIQFISTIVLVGFGWAAAYGAMAYQVSDIRQYGSIPVHELRTEVAVLKEAMKRNSEDHATIIGMLKEMKGIPGK